MWFHSCLKAGQWLKSVGWVQGSAAVWRCSAFIAWTGCTAPLYSDFMDMLRRLINCRIIIIIIIIKVSSVERCTETGGLKKRYELMTQNMDWMSAWRYCRSMQAHLVKIDDKNQQLTLNKYLKQISRTFECLSVCLDVKVQNTFLERNKNSVN